MLVGVLMMLGVLACLWPLIQRIGLQTRVAVAEQSLASYRTAIVNYAAQVVTIPEDAFQPVPKNEEAEETPPSEEEETPPAEEKPSKLPPGPSLGERLMSARKLDQISFPVGLRDLIPGSQEEEAKKLLEPNRPVIWAVSLPELARHFNNSGLFPSARSGRVAVLVVPFLTEKEAEAIQKMLSGRGSKSGRTSDLKVDCFFTRSSAEGMFTGWLYLCDL